jgi:outer membrane receptor protein involved in Fe transport
MFPRQFWLVFLFVTQVTPASAQDPAPTDSTVVTLPAVEAVASIIPLLGGVRSAVPARSIILSTRELHARGTDLTSVLTARAGASMHDDLGSPYKPTLTLRGFHASPVVGLPQGVSVLVDGIAVNEPGAGEVNFDLLPMEFAQSIEVLTGTTSLLGPNALGGAVNIITERGGSTPMHSIELEAGGHGLRSGIVELSGPLGRSAYFVGALHEHEDGWRARMSGERSLVHASFGRPSLGVQATASVSRAETAGSLPLSVYLMRPDSNLTAGDFELVRQASLTAHAQKSVFGGTGAARVYARVADAERFNANQAADPDVRGFTDARTVGIRLDWTMFRPGKSAAQLRVGAGAMANETAIKLFAERIRAGLTTDVKAPITRSDVYAVGGVSFGRMRASAGVRFDAMRVPFRNRIDSARDTTSTFVQLSPRAGLTFNASRTSSFYASVARGFRPPALIEIACADPEEPCPLPFALGDDPPIDPVRVTTYEVGARWSSRFASADLTAYRTDVYDDIFLFPYEENDDVEGSTIDGFFDNVPRTRRQGVELSVIIPLSRRGQIFATWTSTRATFETNEIELFSIREEGGFENDVERGDRFPLVPNHTFSIGADVSIGAAVSAGVVARYMGERFLRGDEANNDEPLAGFTTVDVHASTRLRGVEVVARLRNALNAEYFAFGTYNINQGNNSTLERFVTPGAPRRLEIGAAVRR